MSLCPDGCRPIDDIVATLRTSIKGRVSESAALAVALWLPVLSYQRHKQMTFSMVLAADNEDEELFPITSPPSFIPPSALFFHGI